MRLEDYALTVGAIVGLVAIALTMWMTRNVDWYGGAQASEGSALKGA
jgi:inner membrane protein